MEDVLKVLTLYDLTAYLLPGLVVVWAFLRAAESIRPESPYVWSWKLIVVAYIAGQLLQGVMSKERCWWGEEAIHSRSVEKVFEEEKHTAFRSKLSPAIKDVFDDPPSREWFLLCESYLRARKLESFAEIMQARHGFFRGLFLALVMAALLMVVVVIRSYVVADPHKPQRAKNIALTIVLVIGGILSCMRTNDFEKYYAEGVYRAFYVDYLKEQKQGDLF